MAHPRLMRAAKVGIHAIAAFERLKESRE